MAAASLTSKKAVIVVGPTGYDTAKYIGYGKAIAKVFTDAGVDTRLILPPHATWATVVANANGADFFAYIGHGNGYPNGGTSAFQEDTKDGLGLNPTDGDTNTYNVKYYGANKIINAIHFAPNAIVLLNHVCYASGNASPDQALPNQDTAFKRVDNFASGFLAAGARAVFGLGWQPGEDLAAALVSKHLTVDGFFRWTDGGGSDPQYAPWHGWVGWKPNVFLDSVRTPGAVVHLDESPTEGFLRAVTGDLDFSLDEWRDSGDSDDTTAPVISDLSAGPVSNTTPADGGDLPVFTPNGDGLSDTLSLQHTLSEPAYLDVSVAKGDGTVVRSYTNWSQEGATTDVWDGRNDAANFVSDGDYTLTVTPKDRAGNVGEPASTSVMVLTAMRAPALSPALFNPSDDDALAQTQTQSVTLDKPAVLSWLVTTKAGAPVRTVMTAEPHDPGLVSFTWDGKDDVGAYVPDGVYTMLLTAITDKGTYSHAVDTRIAPFKVSPAGRAVTAGQKVKLTFITAEPQTGWPKVSIKQPGMAKYSVYLVKYSPTKFTATWTVKPGALGTIKVTITGTDTGGGVDTRTLNWTLR
jgi:flagellar hook assembly protein FlgD